MTPSPIDELIERRAREIKAEIYAMFKSARRSIGQNFRYITERLQARRKQ